MINGEHHSCWLWFIWHVSQEVGPWGADMNEETFHVAPRKQHATQMASPDLLSFRTENCFPSYSVSKCSDLTSLGQPSLSLEASRKDKPFILYLWVLYLCILRKEKASVYWLLTVSQPIGHVFSLSSYSSLIRWALSPSSYREIISLSQKHTSIRWPSWEIVPRRCVWTV